MARLEMLEHGAALTRRQLIGPKSERMPTPDEETRAKEKKETQRGGHTNPDKRKENAAARAALPTTVVSHPIAPEERKCPHCGDEVRLIGGGDRSVEYEWVPGRIERRMHVVEVGRCPCKLHYARGPAPQRVQEGCLYGPGLLAKLAVDKCADSLPLYRVERQLRRCGVPFSRSTLNDNLLLAGELLLPLWRCMHDEVRSDPHVQADETRFRLQRQSGHVFVWTFLSKQHTVYVFSESRSGDTAKLVLDGTQGSLTVDGYTGYNAVTDVNGRERTGCWSHARRKLFDALDSAPVEAREGLDIILELFMVERLAADRKILGTAAHLKLRRVYSTRAINKLLRWRLRVQKLFEPKSVMGQALTYLKNQSKRLRAFLRDPLIPIHNNASEAALRIVALARKNTLFFGNPAAARKLMVLYSLVATCVRHDVNPQAYLADVLMRIQDCRLEDIKDLLPHRWKMRAANASA